MASIKFSFLFLLIILVAACQNAPETLFPQPTDPTVVRSYEGEDNADQELKKRLAWFDLMHGGDAHDWRSEEADNQARLYGDMRRSGVGNRGEDETFAEAYLLGRWHERGCENNAGNIEITAYDPETDLVYGVGGGGPMYKGDFSGFGWQLINDKIRFSNPYLHISRLTGKPMRILAVRNNFPCYSDDDGQTWTNAKGIANTSIAKLYQGHVTSDDNVFVLAKTSNSGNFGLYVSFDASENFQRIQIFQTSDQRNLALAIDQTNDDIYIIEQLNVNNTKIYKYNNTSLQLEVINPNSPLGFAEDGRANLATVTDKGVLKLFCYNAQSELYTSTDVGVTWTRLSNFIADPWSVGVYVSPSNPKIMFMGEVNCHISVNGGKNWRPINQWFDYYANINKYLHADIMSIKEYKLKNGKNFILNSNHGGIYRTDDYGANHTNIGIYGLNVSQYYDVRTYPSNPYFIFAGSQDQGQQRGQLSSEGTASLLQNISGDYGHIQFTGNGKSLWSVFPGGSIGFYLNPQSERTPIAGYEIDSNNETVWISPITPGPDPSKNVVIAAGGSTTKNSNGSYLIELTYDAVSEDVVAKQLPFNFGVSGGQVSAITISSHNSNVWFVATTNGQFYKSIDRGKTFVRKQTGLSSGHYLYGSCIIVSPVDSNEIWISGNGYGTQSPVFVSRDQGEKFTKLNAGMPGTTAFKLASTPDASLIFAATESGPFVYVRAKNKWFPIIGAETPNQTFWSVEYVDEIKTARFGTYGRGIWDFEVKEVKTATKDVADNVTKSWKLYPNPATDYIQLKTNGEIVGDVSFDIFDVAGQRVCSYVGQPDQPFYVSFLSNGLYTAVIRKGSYSKTFKFQKL